MVILNPIPYNIASKIMRVKQEFNIPIGSFIYIYKVDYSDKIVCFIENRHITGIIIIVWNNEDDVKPNEHLVILKFYQNLNVYTIREFVVIKGQLYLMKKNYTTELSYYLLKY